MNAWSKFGTGCWGVEAKEPSQPGRRSGRGLQNKQQQHTPVHLVGLGETLSGSVMAENCARCAAGSLSCGQDAARCLRLHRRAAV